MSIASGGLVKLYTEVGHVTVFPLDVVGVVKSAADVTKITTKQTGREVSKRDLQLVDENRVMIRLTLWGADVSVNTV